ncbi:DALR anticodon-binding domain-containing protein [Iningainema tapete]|uniref:DALR anticodon-binding domain-containing protein n=1 Tax=Iningainema tapete TaxID=2806730 RepID=UPI003080BE0E
MAKSEKILALEIANAIASHISRNFNKEFQLQIVSPGWIHFELTHPFLAAWLQGLVEEVGEQGGRRTLEQGNRGAGEMMNLNSPPLPDSLSPSLTNSQTLFTAQYAHARCCSLLRLAHQEGLIKSRLQPIPWLCEEHLRFNHPASWGLISKLVEVVDLEFSCPRSPTAWEKVTLSLAQAFLCFWDNCRIWGETRTEFPELAQSRLGLVMATQSVLSFLLEEKLGISALNEL